jgi:hypothetical protein
MALRRSLKQRLVCNLAELAAKDEFSNFDGSFAKWLALHTPASK